MLKYIGNGLFIPGVPARDLTDEEAVGHGETRLIASGLYQKPRVSKRSYMAVEEVTHGEWDKGITSDSTE